MTSTAEKTVLTDERNLAHDPFNFAEQAQGADDSDMPLYREWDQRRALKRLCDEHSI